MLRFCLIYKNKKTKKPTEFFTDLGKRCILLISPKLRATMVTDLCKLTAPAGKGGGHRH